MQLVDINSKYHGGKILRDIIDCAIGFHFYYIPGLEHYKLLFLDRFHGSTHTNDNHINNNENKII